jgi:hypothetical protein
VFQSKVMKEGRHLSERLERMDDCVPGSKCS